MDASKKTKKLGNFFENADAKLLTKENKKAEF